MSKDNNNNVNGLCVAVYENLTLSSSSSSTPSMAVTSSGSSSFDTPGTFSRTSSTELSTPIDQPIIANYETIGLSPGSLISFNEVQAKIDEDCILSEPFEPKSPLVFRCIYFLYGKAYAWKKTKEERIKKIHEIVGNPDALCRLHDIASPIAGDQLMQQDGVYELYCRVALVAETFFAQEKATGGYPLVPFVRFQKSSNCYASAACILATLQWQKDQPEDQEACKPLDVAHMARRFSIQTDSELEKRVLENRGMCALKFASKLVGLCFNDSLHNWHTFDFDLDESGDTLMDVAKHVVRMVAYGKYGLVTGFIVTEPFREAAEKEKIKFKEYMKKRNENASTPSKKKAAKETDQLPLTYIKFNGNHIDAKGEVVTIPFNTDTEHQARVRQIWEKHLEDIKQQQTEHREKMQLNIPEEWKRKNKSTPKSSDPTTGSDGIGGGKHAMVLLGTYEPYEYDDLTDSWQYQLYFMLLNSWPSLPLVLVSPEYLQACSASVSFLKKKLNKPTRTLERNGRPVGETSFFDGGDDIETSSSICSSDEEVDLDEGDKEEVYSNNW